jgi:peroxiredoxin
LIQLNPNSEAIHMARKVNARLLDIGDVFPKLNLTLTNGEVLRIPRGLTQPYNVILVNRGSWCAFCNAQLRAFQAGLAKLAEASIGIVSLSTDPLDPASAMVRENGIQFPVAYGAPLDPVAEVLGLYYEPTPASVPPHFQSTGFVLGPGAGVVTAVYSSGAIGRLVWQDVLGLVQYLRSHA